MKHIIFLLICLSLVSCDNAYEKAEDNAIQDFANDYLAKNHLKEILNPTLLPGEESQSKPNIDTLDLKVYVSDALLPIAQIKEDNQWMFNDNYFGTRDSTIFHQLVNSGQFRELKYREFDKSKLILSKPYRQFEKSQEKIRADEQYIILYFSRICFDEKKENGIVVIDYQIGYERASMNGYHMALLINKVNDKWTYVPR